MATKKKVKKKIFKKKSAKNKNVKRKAVKKNLPSKQQLNFLREVVESIAGLNSSKIVDLLHNKENVNEFDIAKDMGLTINQARNILYKLGDEGLVSFTRKKDKKNGGWYTYFWTLDVHKSLISLKNRTLQRIDNLDKQVNSKQKKRFYHCEDCDIEVSEENALIYDFTCPECGEVFKLKDNTGNVVRLEDSIKRLKEKLVFIGDEIKIIEDKKEVSKQRRLRLEAAKKKREREARKIERDRLKKIEARKSGKVSKKKVKKKISKKKKVKKKKFSRKKVKKKVVKKKVKKKIKKKVSKKKKVRKKVSKKKRR